MSRYLRLSRSMIDHKKQGKETDPNIPLNHPSVHCYLLIRRCHDFLTAETDNNLASLGITQAQYHVLRILDDLGAINMSEISKLLFRGKSNVTTLIDRMERADLVERVSVEEDRRINKITMTKKGQEIHDSVAEKHRIFLFKLFQNLTEEEVQQLNGLLSKLAHYLKPKGYVFHEDYLRGEQAKKE